MIWSEEQDCLLRQLISTKEYTYAKMIPLLNKPRHQIIERTYELGLTNAGVDLREYKYNDNYFSEYTLENCYFAGYFLADCCIYRNSTIFSWSVANKDKHIMELFCKLVGYNGTIEEYWKECSLNDSGKLYKHNRIKLSNCRWIEDLANKFGITEGKTYRNVPQNFPTEEHKLAFLIGLIDGDGSICKAGTKNPSMTISIVSSSLPTIEWFEKTVLELNLPNIANYGRKILKIKNLYRYAVGGVTAAFLFEKLKAIDVPKLARKWENPAVLDMFKICMLRWRDSFKNPANDEARRLYSLRMKEIRKLRKPDKPKIKSLEISV